MIKLTINNQAIEVPEGTTVLKAAEKLGIHIPTMCYYKDEFSNHPSCMICLVKDMKNGSLQPSCAYPVSEGMEILTDDEEIANSRKEALELLLSDHVGDCEAPCRTACPAYMDIPQMNRLIAAGKFDEALKIVKEEIALPHILGYICPAPCEKVCRRRQSEDAVAICQLKKTVAAEDAKSKENYLPEKANSTGKKVAVIGAGVAGLSAAFHVLKFGHDCDVYDSAEKAGGLIRTQKMAKALPEEVIDSEIEIIEKLGAKFHLSKEISHDELWNIREKYDAVILASGTNSFTDFIDVKSINKDTYETNKESVFACGSILKTNKMAVRSLAQGKQAAYSVHQFLKGEKPTKIHRAFNSRFGNLLDSEIVEYMKESVEGKQVEADSGDLIGYSAEEAMMEAQRCLDCDCKKADNCKLRDLADEYKADRKTYLVGERKSMQKIHHHELVMYEPEKCVRCGICVELTQENKEELGLASIGRGFDVQINVPYGKEMSVALQKVAKECVEACPTGAMAYKRSN